MDRRSRYSIELVEGISERGALLFASFQIKDYKFTAFRPDQDAVSSGGESLTMELECKTYLTFSFL